MKTKVVQYVPRINKHLTNLKYFTSSQRLSDFQPFLVKRLTMFSKFERPGVGVDRSLCSDARAQGDDVDFGLSGRDHGH